MAFEFISIERIARKSEQEPTHRALIKYNGREIYCEIKTNALILCYGNMFCNKVNLSTRLNGDFYFGLEARNCKRKEEVGLENEIIKYARNQDKFKNIRNY